MKKYKFFLPLFLLFLSSILLTAQTIEWKSVYSSISIGEMVSETRSGNYLICGINLYDGKSVASLHRPDGEFIWKKDIGDERGNFLGGVELEDGRLLFVDGEGNLFWTTSDGENVTSLFNIHPAGTPPGAVRQITQKDSLLLISGKGYRNGKSGRLHSIVNLSNLELEHEVFVEGSTMLMGAELSKNNTIVECVSTTSVFIFHELMLDGTPVWEKEIIKEGRSLTDLTIGSNDHIYIVGFIKDSVDQRRDHGLLMSFDQDGILMWEKQYPAAVDANLYRWFTQIDQQGDFLVLGGREHSIFFDAKISVLKCDLNGELIWQLHESILGGAHLTGDLLFNREGKIIVCGTTELTDYIGPERLLVMAVNDLVASYKDEASTLSWDLYPVPTNDYLHLNLPTLVDDYTLEAFDNNGRLIGSWQNQNQVDVRDFPAGSYWLRVTSEEQSAIKKWIKVE